MRIPTFKGNAVARQIRTAEIYYLTGGALKTEGNSSINMNAGNGLNNAGHMVFPKNCDITAGNTQDVNDHLLTGGSISGNCMDAIIKNSSAQGTLLTIGLNDYDVFVGKNYQYDFFYSVA
ncbi:hypothetical protein E4Q46_20110 [Salmonella enterica]|nr:hypothetical protein [Salmonella enterica]ECD3736565.1 hypothetical protein [Salmonella enterica subsp. enterica serovar Stanley]ECZ5203031.1 hypothetical protein [Salmonella enterica subsp. enterica serovar Kentucky]EKI9898853.1 hypothetical protein [Salmonella enterica subsp. enterica]EAQ3032803.1 hypothetical protein [Salmonella enterica]